jgi:Crp-like helix-turn-helix domain
LRNARDVIDHSVANRLLAALSSDERARLLSSAELLELPVSRLLGSAGKPLAHAWFPTSCIISILAKPADYPSFDVGMIGYEGVFSAGCAQGVSASAFDAVVTSEGQAWRVKAHDLACHGQRSPALSALLSRFLSVELSQLGLLVACSRYHSLLQRLSRYLLMSQDRLRAPDILITQSALAEVLGERRRASVTVAAGVLQERGLIRYTRGHILVLNRDGLIDTTCACYEQGWAMYKSMMGEATRESNRGAS